MPGWTLSERELHWLFFAGAFLVVGLWETFRPLRRLTYSNAKRWAGHIVMAALGHLTILLTPISALAVATLAQHSSFGLLNRPALPGVLRWCLAILLLDFVRWLQHLCFHKVEWLWRIHRVHHADPDYDLTTTLRFHPLEVLLTQGSYLVAVYLIGPPPVLALAFELVLLAQNFFGHANVALPAWLEKPVRRFVVTPDMHRIHHSDEQSEQNRNFGSIFPWWDHLFRTYQEAPAAGHRQMAVGLKDYTGDRCLSVREMLLLPFRATEPRPGESVVPPAIQHTSS